MSGVTLRCLLLWVITVPIGAAAAPQDSRTLTPADLIELIDIGAPAVSPDGALIAIETRQASIQQNATRIGWLIVPADGMGAVIDAGEGGEPVLSVFQGQTVGYSKPQVAQWSPDSGWIAYRAKRKGRVQVWRSRRDGSRQEQLTHQEADVESFAWSRDGAKLIFAASSARGAFERGLRDEAQRGFLYDARFAPYYSRAPLFDQTPDLPRSVHVKELASGAEREATADEVRELEAHKRFEVSRYHENLRPARGGVNPPMTVAGCTAPVCTGHFKGAWTRDDGRRISFLRWVNTRDYGPLALYEWRVGSARVREKLRTDALLDGCIYVRSHLICAQESATTPRTLVAIDLDTGRQRTLYEPNPEFSRLQLGEVTALTWHDRNGVEGFGHFVKPVGFKPGQRYPLVIVQYRSRGFLRGGIGDEYPIHLFATAGFAVLSFHRPDEWELEIAATSADEVERQGWIGFHDRRRVLSVLEAGVDHLANLGLIDPDRVGITGLSDGGETVAFALIHAPQRFAAASATWTCWNPLAYFLHGPKFQPRLHTWGIPNPDADSEHFWRGVSVGLNAARIDTPLLLQVADRELLAETHTVTALTEHHKPVEMHVFPDEHHIKYQPIHRYHAYRRNLQWFQFWLQEVEAPDPVDERQYQRWRELRAASSRAATPRPSHTRAAGRFVRPEAADLRPGAAPVPPG